MISKRKLSGKEHRFFHLLEINAAAAVSSIKALQRQVANPQAFTDSSEFVMIRRRTEAVIALGNDTLCTRVATAVQVRVLASMSKALDEVPRNAQRIAERIKLGPQFLRDVSLIAYLALLEQATETVLVMLKDLRASRTQRVQFHNDQLQAMRADANKRLLRLLGSLYAGNNEPVG